MSIGPQMALVGLGRGKGHLFAPGVLTRYLEEEKTTSIADADVRAKSIREWLDALDQTEAGERSLDRQFTRRILCDVLGYTPQPELPSTLYAEPSTKVTGVKGTPDAVLGLFTQHSSESIAVVELKPPGTDLDRPQPNYDNRTPVEQAFDYATQMLGVTWVVVSNMVVLRLYRVERNDEYEEVNLADCVTATGKPAEEFRRLHFVLHHDVLIAGGPSSPLSHLYSKSTAQQLRITEEFYAAYYDIRMDLYKAVAEAASTLKPAPTRAELLEATQRLLDRLLFICYCEDHPQKLISDGTIAKVVNAATNLPGPSGTKVYEHIKALFREVDSGSPATSGLDVPGYNGELFKDHWIIDHIDLPDALNGKVYGSAAAGVPFRKIRGVWGLHVYDFWTELNEHLLGHIFEESLSDLQSLGADEQETLSEKLEQRKKHGIFYTTQLLSDFLTNSALRATLDELAPLGTGESGDQRKILEARRDALLGLKVIDFACGSGAFIVSAYREMLRELSRCQSAINTLAPDELNLMTIVESKDQAAIIRECLFGIDMLPQATEIAKLALWLRSAQRHEKVADLSEHIVSTDSLCIVDAYARLAEGPGAFDLVIGNPPWGGEISEGVREGAAKALNIAASEDWDSWELFLMLAVDALREGGRLALLLPDSFFYSDKARIREHLFTRTTPEKIHYLGPDWFGPKVRMGTVFVQARRGPCNAEADMSCMVLAGDLRKRTTWGEVPLTQAQAQRSRLVPIRRTLDSPTRDVEVFRGVKDDDIMAQMDDRSEHLASLCERSRGEEMSKAGLAWQCPACLMLTTPGTKKKGGGYHDKTCACGHTITEDSVTTLNLVTSEEPTSREHTTFIDGDDTSHRYAPVTPSKWLVFDQRWTYKKSERYASPKILVRQAGVGLVAVLDETGSRCPQSVYIYRLKDEYAKPGYRHEFLLGALLSRTMNYYHMKRSAETDPAKAFAKVTHERLADLPIPRVDFADAGQRKAHKAVVTNVKRLLSGQAVCGGKEDIKIEQALRELWGICPADGHYINGEFHDLPKGQVVDELFPGDERPKPVPEHSMMVPDEPQSASP